MNITELAPAAPASVQPSPRSPVKSLPEYQRPLVQEHPAAARREKQEVSKKEQSTAKKPVQEEHLDHALEMLNSAAQSRNRSILFNLQSDSGRVQVKVVDKDTDKVIREIPSEEVMAMVEKLHDYIGMLTDEKR